MHTDAWFIHSGHIWFFFIHFRSSVFWTVSNWCVLVQTRSWTSLSFHETKNGILRRFPRNSKQLDMNDLISVNDFINDLSNFLLVHTPNHIKSSFIWLLESSKLFLKFFKLDCNSFVLLSKLNVLIFIKCILLVESLFVFS